MSVFTSYFSAFTSYIVNMYLNISESIYNSCNNNTLAIDQNTMIMTKDGSVSVSYLIFAYIDIRVI